MKTAEELLKEFAPIEVRILEENGFYTANLERAVDKYTEQFIESLGKNAEETIEPIGTVEPIYVEESPDTIAFIRGAVSKYYNNPKQKTALLQYVIERID